MKTPKEVLKVHGNTRIGVFELRVRSRQIWITSRYHEQSFTVKKHEGLDGWNEMTYEVYNHVGLLLLPKGIEPDPKDGNVLILDDGSTVSCAVDDIGRGWLDEHCIARLKMNKSRTEGWYSFAAVNAPIVIGPAE